MRLLLDTHTLLWWLDDPARLVPPARAAIADTANDVLVSAAVAWEMSIIHALGKLKCPDDLVAVIARNGFRPLLVSIRHALVAGGLPPHHTDPLGRLLVAQAQAQTDGLTLVTRDPALQSYGVAILVA